MRQPHYFTLSQGKPTFEIKESKISAAYLYVNIYVKEKTWGMLQIIFQAGA